MTYTHTQKAKRKTGKTTTESLRKRVRMSHVAGNEVKDGDGTWNSIVRGVRHPID
jgi:hypothetical protein